MPAADYFESLGLERRLQLDPSELQQRFYRLSRELHPDRFARASSAERERALEKAAVLNDAYRTLRDPVTRAEYFLRCAGVEARAAGGPPRELLEEVFELNEALEELQTGARERIEAETARLLGMRAETGERLEQLFAECDAGGSPAVLAAIRAVLDRRKYIEGMLRRIPK